VPPSPRAAAPARLAGATRTTRRSSHTCAAGRSCTRPGRSSVPHGGPLLLRHRPPQHLLRHLRSMSSAATSSFGAARAIELPRRIPSSASRRCRCSFSLPSSKSTTRPLASPACSSSRAAQLLLAWPSCLARRSAGRQPRTVAPRVCAQLHHRSSPSLPGTRTWPPPVRATSHCRCTRSRRCLACVVLRRTRSKGGEGEEEEEERRGSLVP